MKSILRTSVLLAILGLGIDQLWAEKMFEGDSLGSLKLSQSATAVTKALGQPKSTAGGVLIPALRVEFGQDADLAVSCWNVTDRHSCEAWT